MHPIYTFRSISSELAKIAMLAADPSSCIRYIRDSLFCRARGLFRLASPSKERRIFLHGDISLTYRENRGDLQSIREVWLDEAYRLPFTPPKGVLVDLGANIGMTSVWLAKRYGYSDIIAVEPSASNARLARINCGNNGLRTDLLEVAIGPRDGMALFEEANASNLGRVGSRGAPVTMVSMQTLLRRLPVGASVGLAKMDIEGAEEALLLEGDLTWLERVQAVIAEFHPDCIDYVTVINSLKNAGFSHIPAGSAHADSMDAFIRVT